MRNKFVAGNWKMNTSRQSAADLSRAVLQSAGNVDGVLIALCPPFPYLGVVGDIIKESKIQLGGQNLYPEKEGAFTGEVSAAMLLDCGCTYVILGHSERRHVIGESDDFINRKVKLALASGLEVILCIGEKLEEREAGKTEQVLDHQVTQGLSGLDSSDMRKIVIAYEPVWAIGTGKTATPDQAQSAHEFIRDRVAKMYDAACADNLLIQYGGSVKPDNAAELMAQPDVDGALVGGASLNAEAFAAIIQAAD